MTKLEIKEELSKYYIACKKCEHLKERIERLKSNKVLESEITERIEELNNQLKNSVLEADSSLAIVLELISLLDDTDGDGELLKLYHINGYSEKKIARQLNYTTDYIRIKRWRAYEKLSKKKA